MQVSSTCTHGLHSRLTSTVCAVHQPQEGVSVTALQAGVSMQQLRPAPERACPWICLFVQASLPGQQPVTTFFEAEVGPLPCMSSDGYRNMCWAAACLLHKGLSQLNACDPVIRRSLIAVIMHSGGERRPPCCPSCQSAQLPDAGLTYVAFPSCPLQHMSVLHSWPPGKPSSMVVVLIVECVKESAFIRVRVGQSALLDLMPGSPLPCPFLPRQWSSDSDLAHWSRFSSFTPAMRQEVGSHT
jgi:hypothetical protein